MRSNKIVYFDTKSKPRFLIECPVNSFALLRELYGLYWDLVLEFDPSLNKSFFELAELNPEILETAIAIVELLGGKRQFLGIETLAGFIHSFVDEENQPSKGLIWQRYFEKKLAEDSTVEGLPFEEYRSLLLAALAESEGGLKNAQEILDITSEEELTAFFKARGELDKKRKLDPENKKADRERLKKEYYKKFPKSK